MNQKQLYILGANKLNQFQIQNSNNKAKQLLCFVLKQTKEQFVFNEDEKVAENKKSEYEMLLNKLIEGTPLQYITNKQEFMGLTFYVDKNVLIPQPDTETLVEEAINLIKKDTTELNIKILDLCTGSGAIGISIANYITNAKVTLSDISPKAIEIAKKNASFYKVEHKTEFICSDLWQNIHEKQFNYIISNPPYIKTSTIKKLSKDVQNEPNLALNGGTDGLNFYRLILKEADKYLAPGGYLLLEIGFDQGEDVIQIGKNNLALKCITPKPIKDLGGNDRVIIFQKL